VLIVSSELFPLGNHLRLLIGCVEENITAAMRFKMELSEYLRTKRVTGNHDCRYGDASSLARFHGHQNCR
jgi:hypothetical protein